MKYAILKNGVLEYAPVNYKTSSGNIIVNFNKNENVMEKFGYKEVITQKPSFDENTEYLVIIGYTETENNIIINYEVKQKVIESSLEEKIKELQEENKTQDILIDTTMLATDEIFTMIEPILEAIPQTMTLERSTSKMVDMYVCMIQRGLKTIEEVPTRYREEVKRILVELEK